MDRGSVIENLADSDYMYSRIHVHTYVSYSKRVSLLITGSPGGGLLGTVY